MIRYTFITLCLIAAGCETSVENPDWPAYQEKGIMHTDITVRPDSVVVSCNLGRTIPLNETFDFLSSRIHDAHIVLESGGRAHDVPRKDSDSENFSDYYNYQSAIKSDSSREFIIRADWGGKRLQGSLTIPRDQGVVIDTIIVRTHPTDMNQFIIRLRWLAYPGFLYVMRYNGPRNSGTSGPYRTRENAEYMELEFPRAERGTWRFEIEAENQQYRRWWTNDSNDPFDPPGSNPRHNIFGDGFGFFTYRMTSPRRTVVVQ